MDKGLRIFKFTVIGVLCVFLFGYITMSLWNWLMPVLFKSPQINFWQALGLLILSKILFSGFGGKRWGNHSANWKQRYATKLSGMSPEERERFKARVREKWCSRADDDSSGKTGPSNV
jgi:hypothetical protein